MTLEVRDLHSHYGKSHVIQGVSLNVFLRNIQPGVAIDYATGNNWADEAATAGSWSAPVASGSLSASASQWRRMTPASPVSSTR